MADDAATPDSRAEPSLKRVMGPWLLLLFIVGDMQIRPSSSRQRPGQVTDIAPPHQVLLSHSPFNTA